METAVLQIKDPAYNTSSNPVERFHRTLTAMLRTQGPGEDNWDVWLNSTAFMYNTTVSSSAGVTPHYDMFGREETLPVE